MIFLKLFLFIAVLIISFYLISLQELQLLSDHSLYIKIILGVLSGLFYTSFLSSPLSVVLFIILGKTTNIYLLTLFGGIGAVIGDLLIVKFFRLIFKSFSFISHLNLFKKFRLLLKKYHLDLIGFIIGIIIVISPFPDELGLALLGASKLSYFKLAILTLILNSIGIFIILYTTRAFL